jgi:signal peptidase I
VDKFGDYISIILKEANISNSSRKELQEEIRDHLEMLKIELIKEGYTEEQAVLMSIEKFGEIEYIKKGFRKVFTPYRRFIDAINQKRFLKETVQWTATIVGAFAISLFIKSYAFAATEVEQCSMQGTLYEGQRLIESKIEYYCSEPRRGDIVIINQESEKGAINIFVATAKEFAEGFYKKQEDQKKRLIKRIIGVPGDVIDIKDKKVYINGQIYNEPYIKGDTFARSMKFPIKVPEKEYFVLGDNRENSMDSRDLGLIKLGKIEGKAVLRLWPLDKVGKVCD